MADTFLVTEFELFVDPFKQSIKDSHVSDYNVLNTLEARMGRIDDWENQHGVLANLVREVVKRHFPTLTIEFIPWVVPQCCEGVRFLLGGDTATLNGVAQRLQLKTGDYEITDYEGALAYIDTVTM
jgi:hypothetical protein